MAEVKDGALDALPAFAAAVAHEIRTPLSVVAGEVELALSRDRSSLEYREALRRIGESVEDLVAITGDLSLIGAPAETGADPPPVAPIECVLISIAERYSGWDDVIIAVEPAAGLAVAADTARLRRAIGRILEHAIRHRRDGAVVELQVEPSPGHVRLVVQAEPPGFWPRAWRALAGGCTDPETPLRLRTARHILDAIGGSLRLSSAGGRDRVLIELPLA